MNKGPAMAGASISAAKSESPLPGSLAACGKLPPYVFLLAAAFYLLLCGCVAAISLHLTRGNFTYALDDAYIHLALAKNISLHGVFGVNSHEFAAASSSILWPYLLASVFVFTGPVLLVPLLLQIPIALLILWLAYRMLRSYGITSGVYACCILCGLVLVAPMVAMTFVAMEHLLHALATLLFALVAVDYLHDERPGIWIVLGCAALLTSVRYEGGFLVAAVALLFLVGRKIWQAVAVSAAGLVPMVGFGLYSLSQGGFFLPNSLLIKGPHHPAMIVYHLFTLFRDCPEIFVLVAAALLLLCAGEVRGKGRSLLILFLLATLLHQALASFGWFFRYEAYLVTFGFITIAAVAPEAVQKLTLRRAWAFLFLLVLATPLFFRGALAMVQTPIATSDIYHQQVQLARFFQRYYPSGRIALNDIGAVSYFSDPYLTDLVGLGSTEIARAQVKAFAQQGAKGRHSTDAGFYAIEKNHIEVIAIYKDWFELNGDAPKGWIEVGSWKPPGSRLLGHDFSPVILGGKEITFYGVGAENAARLKRNLEEFHASLPPENQKLATP